MRIVTFPKLHSSPLCTPFNHRISRLSVLENARNKNKIEYNSFLISDINYIKDDDEENQFKVSLPDKYIVFEIKYFASQEDFDEFRSLFN